MNKLILVLTAEEIATLQAAVAGTALATKIENAHLDFKIRERVKVLAQQRKTKTTEVKNV